MMLDQINAPPNNHERKLAGEVVTPRQFLLGMDTLRMVRGNMLGDALGDAPGDAPCDALREVEGEVEDEVEGGVEGEVEGGHAG